MLPISAIAEQIAHMLNARRTDEKYRGSYEASIMKRFTQFANSPHLVEDAERFFILIALNCDLRNGDAPLRNFGIVYDDVQGEARLAPVYDLVTTSAYLPKDSMALTLNGSTRWPSAKDLQRLGETRMGGSPAGINTILERIADAMFEVASAMMEYIKTHPEVEQVGSQMLAYWQGGLKSHISGPV